MDRRTQRDVRFAEETKTSLLYVALVFDVFVVNDGWSGRPSPFLHQVFLLPFAVLFFVFLGVLLRTRREPPRPGPVQGQRSESVHCVWGAIWLCTFFEVLSIAGFAYEARHFRRFGYLVPLHAAVEFLVSVGVALSWVWWRRSAYRLFGGAMATYCAGLLLAICCFPLNYLRSDMLPVILWSDTRLLSHLNPYATMHVGSRLYDFPYLPGMLVAFLPAVPLHADLRLVTLGCMVATGLLLYLSAKDDWRFEAAALLGVFLLDPFLQYRHDLYLEPHWLALAGSIVLLRKNQFAWAAVVFGLSMALYQLSWVVFPFFVLYRFRRSGPREAIKSTLLCVGGMLVVVGPFLRSATQRIAVNTVGQWSHLPHALADPINLSYWVTFLVRPDQLKWVQLGVMTLLFCFCMIRGKCQTLVDTLRWMSGALALFIALNVLVDGYFYLTLLLLLLMYIYAATGIWPDPSDSIGPDVLAAVKTGGTACEGTL